MTLQYRVIVHSGIVQSTTPLRERAGGPHCYHRIQSSYPFPYHCMELQSCQSRRWLRPPPPRPGVGLAPPPPPPCMCTHAFSRWRFAVSHLYTRIRFVSFLFSLCHRLRECCQPFRLSRAHSILRFNLDGQSISNIRNIPIARLESQSLSQSESGHTLGRRVCVLVH